MTTTTADPTTILAPRTPKPAPKPEPKPASSALRAFAWKRYAGIFAYQTVLLCAGVLVAWAAATTAVIADVLPLWAGFAVNAVAAYAAFTVMHEASHGNIHGRHARLSWVDPTLGWLAAFLLLAPYPAFKLLHLRHHSRTNHDGEDPDLWVAGRTPLGVALRCLTIVPHYYATFLFGRLSKAPGARRIRALGVAYLGVVAAVTIAAASTGTLAWALGLWIGPGVLAASALAFAFDYLPHHPHTVRERLHDTRVIVAPGLWLLFLWQNYHLVHHLYPRVPFFRYAKCFESMRPALERAGAPMWI